MAEDAMWRKVIGMLVLVGAPIVGCLGDLWLCM